MSGLARALSKLGHCSRSQAVVLIRAGRVSLNGRPCRNPETPVEVGTDIVSVDGAPVDAAAKVYLMLNKPRGLVTTARDEKGRATVYDCFKDRSLSMPSPPSSVQAVGRLDKASEGLLLFTNDTAWAARITDPETHLNKTYHVQVACLIDEPLLTRLRAGSGELKAKAMQILRQGGRNTWLAITLDEGRNRHIRRLLEAFDIEVLRLVRVAIGNLQLGDLPKGCWRELTPAEVAEAG